MFSGLNYQRGAPVIMSKDQKKLYFVAKPGTGNTEGITEVDLAKGTNRLIKLDLDVSNDQAEVRAAAFEQFWTLTKNKFFDPGLNGVDWDAARRKYERFLPSIIDARDLAELLSEMSGELEASHTAGGFRGSVPRGEQTASLGLYYDERYPGPGMKVTEVFANGPFDIAETALKPGDVLRQIDGEDIPIEGGIRRMLRGRANQLVAVTVEHPDGRRFTEKRVAVGLDRERVLARSAGSSANARRRSPNPAVMSAMSMSKRWTRDPIATFFPIFSGASAPPTAWSSTSATTAAATCTIIC